MTTVAAGHGEVPLGTTVAEIIRTLRGVPVDATLIEHFGAVDLVTVFRHDRPVADPTI